MTFYTNVNSSGLSAIVHHCYNADMLVFRWLLNSLALLLLSNILDGFEVSSFYTAVLVAMVLGLVNATIRWALIILTLPINLLSLGTFTFAINALMILLVSTIVKGFNVHGFWPDFVAAVALWLISFGTNWLLRDPDRR